MPNKLGKRTFEETISSPTANVVRVPSKVDSKKEGNGEQHTTPDRALGIPLKLGGHFGDDSQGTHANPAPSNTATDDRPLPTAMPEQTTPNSRHSAGPWNAHHDAQLMRARWRGMNWASIAKEFFPTRSANACRKRHVRLVDKVQGAEDWGHAKLDNMAKKSGKDWKTVETKVCSPLPRRSQLLTNLAAHGK